VCHHASEPGVKFSENHTLEIAVTKETAVIKGSLMFKYWLDAQDQKLAHYPNLIYRL